jgi:Holliday junction resolvase RusA-like endonuclease
MNTITLTLPYPISANRYWATRTVTPKGKKPMAMTYVTPEAKAFKAEVMQLVRAAGVVAPIIGRVQLEIKLYPHRPLDWQKRQRQAGAAWDDSVQCIDLGNAEKVLSDALKDLVMEDDRWIRKIISERMEPDALPARVVVTVSAMPKEVVNEELF